MAINNFLDPLSQEEEPDQESGAKEEVESLWGRGSDDIEEGAEDYDSPFAPDSYDDYGNEIPEEEDEGREEENNAEEGQNTLDQAKEGIKDAEAAAKAIGSEGADVKADVQLAKSLLKNSPLGHYLKIGCAAIALILTLAVIFSLAFMGYGNLGRQEAEAAEPPTICLDPGHSPNPSNGKTGAPGELELNWKTATEVKALLEADGYKVVFTRKEKEDIDNSLRPKKCQAAGAPFLYAIHHNDAPGKKGPFHIIPKPARKNIYDASKKYANTIEDTIVKKLGVANKTSGDQPVNGGVCEEGSSCTSDNLEIVKSGDAINLPVMYIEIMALNPQGTAWINNPSNRTKMNRAIADGLEKAVPKTGGANGEAIAKQAISYVKNPSSYASDYHLSGKSITDCGGFVTTVFAKLKIDPKFVEASKGLSASQYIQYFKSHPEKYQIVSENVTSTSILKPGDVLLNKDHGSHAAIFIGRTGNGNKAQASLDKHPPEFGNWYSALHIAVRLK